MGVSGGVVTARNAFRVRLKADYVSLKGWKAVGAKFGISGGMAFRIAQQGYWPKDKAICERLNKAILPQWVTVAADWLQSRQKQ